jgi:futalosine hydrolase
MRILIIAATVKELTGLRDIRSDHHTLEFFVSGIGMLETAFHLTRKLTTDRYDLLINCGLAGSFDKSILIGQAVEVEEEIVSELGAQDGESFIPIDEIPLPAEFKFFNISSIKHDLKKVRSVSVNTVHGNSESINRISARLRPDVENMEGAAVFFVCQKLQIPFIEVRAISNYVERRNKDNWNIPLALQKLRETISKIINEI